MFSSSGGACMHSIRIPLVASKIRKKRKKKNLRLLCLERRRHEFILFSHARLENTPEETKEIRIEKQKQSNYTDLYIHACTNRARHMPVTVRYKIKRSPWKAIEMQRRWTHARIPIYIAASLDINKIYIYIHSYVHKIDTHTYVLMQSYTCTYMYVCVYPDILHIYIYLYTYIYMHIHRDILHIYPYIYVCVYPDLHLYR